MQPVQDLLLLCCAEGLQVLAAAGRDQEEHAPHRCPQVDHGLQHPWQLKHIAPGDGGVDLQAETHFTNGARGLERGVEDSADAPEGVMALGAGPIQGQRDRLGSGVMQLDQDRAGEPVGHGGRKGHAQTDPGAVSNQLGQVRSLEGVAAGQDDEWAR